MVQEILGTRRFMVADQETFATLSGDRNPMHMDPVAARRTQAGAPVVHGIHTLLWLLDILAHRHPDLPGIATLRVRFDKLVYVGDRVEAVLTQLDAAGLRVELMVEGAIAFRLQAGFGSPRSASDDAETSFPLYAPASETTPLDLNLDDMANSAGRIGFAVPTIEIARAFPDAARAWGPRRISALACSTYLVGMVCPGLHSIFGGLALSVCHDAGIANSIVFKVTRTDTRFGMVRLEINGSGLSGTVESFARHPPASQRASSTLGQVVTEGEFARSTALVVGGSRGVGELIAKDPSEDN